LRLIVSTLPGDTLETLKKRAWSTHLIQPLSTDECKRMIVDYLKRFGKKLDDSRLIRLANSPATSNPLYLKILLDELRVTGTHDKLDERLDDYLAAKDIPDLLGKVLARYQRDYEHDQNDLVGKTLGLIWAARRGLTETELLQLLKPKHLPQLPLATWAPLRAALEESLVDHGGIFNFAHDFMRTAVETAFLPNLDTKDDFRIVLADFFEAQSPTARSCDELPWLLRQTELFERLRKCLLNIDRFLNIFERDQNELHQYWVVLGEETTNGRPYLDSFNRWADNPELSEVQISFSSIRLATFLHTKLFHTKEAEQLYLMSMKIEEKNLGKNHPDITALLNNFAALLCDTKRKKEAILLMRRSLEINKKKLGENHPIVASDLNNLANILSHTNQLEEAESLLLRALKIDETIYGMDHPSVATDLNNLALVLVGTNRLNEAERLMRRALEIDEKYLGREHYSVAMRLSNLAIILTDTRRLREAEPLLWRALEIQEKCFGKEHPLVANSLYNIAMLLRDTNHINEAEALMRRAIEINEIHLISEQPVVARDLNSLADILITTNRLQEAEPLMRRALKILENNLGIESLEVARNLNNLAQLLKATNRLKEAEPLSRRVVDIFVNSSRTTGHQHPHLRAAINNYTTLLQTMGWSEDQIVAQLRKMAPEFF